MDEQKRTESKSPPPPIQENNSCLEYFFKFFTPGNSKDFDDKLTSQQILNLIINHTGNSDITCMEICKALEAHQFVYVLGEYEFVWLLKNKSTEETV